MVLYARDRNGSFFVENIMRLLKKELESNGSSFLQV
jgi:hypothetical protein